MPKPRTRAFFALLGYELELFDEALGLRMSYGEPRETPDAKEGRLTPTMFLMPDEARELARDLLAAADKIEVEKQPPPDTPLH